MKETRQQMIERRKKSMAMQERRKVRARRWTHRPEAVKANFFRTKLV